MSKKHVIIEGPTDLEEMSKYQDYFKDLENFVLENDEYGCPQIRFLAEEEDALERFGKFCSENPDEIFYNMLFRDEDGELLRSFNNGNGEVGEKNAAKPAAKPVAKPAARVAPKPTDEEKEKYDDMLNFLDNLDEDEDEDEE